MANQMLGKQCEQSAVGDVVGQLILLAGKSSQSSLVGSDIPHTVQAALSTTMQLLSAADFFAVVKRLLGSVNDQVCQSHNS